MTPERLQRFNDSCRRQKEDNETLSIGNITALAFEELRPKAKLRLEICNGPPFTVGGKHDVKAFTWDPKHTEVNQASSYMSHQESIVKWTSRSSAETKLLDCTAVGVFGRNLKGTTDVVVASRQAVLGDMPHVGLHLMWELKKSVPTAEDGYRAMTVLLAGALMSPDHKPIMVRNPIKLMGLKWKIDRIVSMFFSRIRE